MLEEKIRFAEHLSLMIKGGVPLGEALEILAAESQSKIFKKALGGVSKKILSGESLANSLESYPKVFDKFFYNVVSAGEKGGTLDKNLKYLSSQLRQEFEVKNKIKGALIYPCLVIVMASGIAFFVSFFILPKITGLFKTLAIELPLATKILITSTSFLRQYWILTLAAIIFIILLFRIILKFNFSRFYFDKIILSLPFLSRLFKNMNLARFSRALGTLLKSGVPIVEALEICAKVLPNEVYKKNIISVKFQIERGGKINQGLKNFPGIFPLVFSQMVAVGEITGSLEESLSYLAEFHEREVDSTLKNISGIIEPVLLILVGVFVAFIAMAIIIPIYRFTGQLRFR